MGGSSVRRTGLPRIDPEVAMVGNLYSRLMGRRADTVVIRNRRARYDYLVLDSFECGIVLAGSEVKSIRAGRANLQDAYARVEDGELWLHGMHIAPYEFSRAELDPTRRRKLLLHRKEIDTLARATGEKGVTLRSEEHTSELQSQSNLVCRLLLGKNIKDDISAGLALDVCPCRIGSNGLAHGRCVICAAIPFVSPFEDRGLRLCGGQVY